MQAFFDSWVNQWTWSLIGTLFFIMEVFVPGAHFMWMGASALVLAAIVWLIPTLDWEFQLLIFATLSVISILVWKKLLEPRQKEQGDPSLNRRMNRYIGQFVTITDAIQGGVGRAKLGDSTWRVQGPDAQVGDQLKVVDVNGATLVVDHTD